MKTKIKTHRAPKRRAQRNHDEENIFNPFAPLMSALRKKSSRARSESGGTFRSAFITVLLVHVIAAMGFATYSAVSKATKTTTSAQSAPKKKSESRVEQILNGPSAKMSASQDAEPGHKIEAVRAKDPFSSEPAKPRPALVSGKEEDLPPLAAVPAKRTEAAQTKAAEATNQEPAKQAFLTATGRLAPSEEQVIPASEIRRAEPVTRPIQQASAPAQPPMPHPSQYTVRAGDNIFTISRRMNVSFTELAEANNLSSPRDVRVGQVLVSPSAHRDSM